MDQEKRNRKLQYNVVVVAIPVVDVVLKMSPCKPLGLGDIHTDVGKRSLKTKQLLRNKETQLSSDEIKNTVAEK